MKMTLQQALTTNNMSSLDFVLAIISKLPNINLNTVTQEEYIQCVAAIVEPFLLCYVYNFEDFLAHYVTVFTSAIILNSNQFLMYMLKNSQIIKLINMIGMGYTTIQNTDTDKKLNETESITRNYKYSETESVDNIGQSQTLDSDSYTALNSNNQSYFIHELSSGSGGGVAPSSGQYSGNIAQYQTQTDTETNLENKSRSWNKTESESKTKTADESQHFNNEVLKFDELNTLQIELNNYLKPILNKIAKSFYYLDSSTNFKGVYWM